MSITAALSIFSLAKGAWDSYMKVKEVKRQGKLEITKAKVEAKIKKINNQYQMDANAANDMRYSWKDEFFVVLLAFPYIMSFIPGLDIYVLKGFEVMAKTPDWYQYSFLGAIAATFGLRAWFNGFKK